MRPSTRSFFPLLLIIFTYGLGYFLVIPVFFRVILDNSTGMISPSISPSLKYIFLSLSIGLDAFGYVIGAPIMGTWSDNRGRRKILLYSLWLTLFGYALPIVGIMRSEIGWVFLGRLISGFASSTQSLAQSAVADMSDGQQKATYFAVISVAMTLSILLGPPIGSFLSDKNVSLLFNEKTPFYVALALVFSALLLMRFYSDKNQIKNEEFHLTMKNFGVAFFEAISTNHLKKLFILFFLSQLGWSFFYQDIILYLTQKFNFTLNASSLFMAYTGICMAVGLALYKYLIRHCLLQTVLLWSFVACSLSFIAWGITANSFLLYFVVIPASLGAGLTQPTIMTLLSDAVRPEKQGWVLGLAASSFAAPWCISAFTFGILSELDLRYPLIISILSFIIGVFICITHFDIIKLRKLNLSRD